MSDKKMRNVFFISLLDGISTSFQSSELILQIKMGVWLEMFTITTVKCSLIGIKFSICHVRHAGFVCREAAVSAVGPTSAVCTELAAVPARFIVKPCRASQTSVCLTPGKHRHCHTSQLTAHHRQAWGSVVILWQHFLAIFLPADVCSVCISCVLGETKQHCAACIGLQRLLWSVLSSEEMWQSADWTPDRPPAATQVLASVWCLPVGEFSQLKHGILRGLWCGPTAIACQLSIR